MVIPVELVKPTILAWLQQMREAQCEADHEGTVFELEEIVEFSMDVAAPEGINLIPRLQVSDSDGKTDVQTEDERITTTNNGQETSTTTTDPSSTTSTTTTTNPDRITDKTSDAFRDETIKTTKEAIRTTREDPGVREHGQRIHSGGNGTTETYTHST